ncbi:uncharacterized protein BDZ99DRAFT_568776 [Mytilinidion resinicola]|uniref:F-box domain-containing protein n=1 Tax=Mytilinidion resinicola TaxID=574789 RepID=A0A6A6Z0D6_9PEZI|nr:uncharacterized protein BDZ99DRAFT_568776 [Mytilinidion resinicola]KAF2813635.1 hypothetical protein BDZ99DRAFT_568776 [Mytilinidion resinicola]
MAADAEMKFAFAALILADAGLEITAEKLLTLVRAAGMVGQDPTWAMLFARALDGKTGRDAKQGLLKSKNKATRTWSISPYHRHPEILPDFRAPNTFFRRWSSSKRVQGPALSERFQKVRRSTNMWTIHDEYARINILTFRCAAVKLNRLPPEIRLQIFREVFPRPSSMIKYTETSGSTVVTVLHGSRESRVFQRLRNRMSFDPDEPVYVTANLQSRSLNKYKYWLDPQAVGRLAFEAAEVIAHAVFILPTDTDALAWLGNEASSMNVKHLVLGHGEPESLVDLQGVLGRGLARLRNLERVDLLLNKSNWMRYPPDVFGYGVLREMFELVKDLVSRGLEVNYVPFVDNESCELKREYRSRAEDYVCHERDACSTQESLWWYGQYV